MKYKIVRHKEYDEKAELKREYYSVAELKNHWLFGESWKPIIHIGYSDSLTTFPSLPEVREFIGRLQNGTPCGETTEDDVEFVG